MAILRKKHSIAGSRTKPKNTPKGLAKAADREESKKLFLKALLRRRGLVTPALDDVGRSFDWYKDNIRSDPDFAEAVHECNERNLDKAESSIMDHIEDGDVTANIFFLRCKGKHRGYVERQELRVGGDQEVPLIDSSMVGQLVSKLLEADQKKLDEDN